MEVQGNGKLTRKLRIRNQLAGPEHWGNYKHESEGHGVDAELEDRQGKDVLNG